MHNWFLLKGRYNPKHMAALTQLEPVAEPGFHARTAGHGHQISEDGLPESHFPSVLAPSQAHPVHQQ